MSPAKPRPDAAPNLGPRARQRRIEILEAAERLFAQQGYRATTTDQIARAVGISQPAIYRYFPTKHDLLLEALRFRQDEMFFLYGEALSEQSSALQKMRRLAQLHAELIERHPYMGLLRAQTLATPSDPEIRAGALGTLRILMGSHEMLFRKAQEEGDVRPDVDAAAAARCVSALGFLDFASRDFPHGDSDCPEDGRGAQDQRRAEGREDDRKDNRNDPERNEGNDDAAPFALTAEFMDRLISLLAVPSDSSR